MHAFVPVTATDLTGALCPVAVVYASTNTACAVPATIGETPDPTRTTVNVVASNGLLVPVDEGVTEEEGVTVRGGVTEELAVAGAV